MESTDRDYGAAQQIQVVAASAVIILTVLLLSWIKKRRRASQRFPLPPGPRGWPVLGSLPSLGTLPHKSLRNLSTKFGPIMYLHLGSVPTLVVSNAGMAKEILKTNDQNMASRPFRIIPAYVTYNQQDVAWAPYGSFWRQVRKICTLELLTASRISQFQGMREREVRSVVQGMVEESQNETILSMDEVFGNMTMNMMTQMLWQKRYEGIKGQSQSDFGKVMRELLNLVGEINIADFLPAGFKSPFMTIQGLSKRMKDVHEKMDLFLESIIREHQDKQLRSEEQTASDADDFVDVLLKLSKSGEAISPGMMKAVLLDMFAAGADTSAVTMEWALAELIKHPTVLSKVQDELNSVVGPERLVRGNDIPNLKYLQAVVKETFRMHPPAPLGIPHKSDQDCNIANYHIPANTTVIVNIHAIHRDPATYKRPEEFDPNRFLRSPKEFKGTDFELIPFGAGRRMCPGMNLGSATAHLGLAQMIHAFKWTLPDVQKPEEVDMTEVFGLVVIKADPLKVLAKPRLRRDVYYAE